MKTDPLPPGVTGGRFTEGVPELLPELPGGRLKTDPPESLGGRFRIEGAPEPLLPELLGGRKRLRDEPPELPDGGEKLRELPELLGGRTMLFDELPELPGGRLKMADGLPDELPPEEGGRTLRLDPLDDGERKLPLEPPDEGARKLRDEPPDDGARKLRLPLDDPPELRPLEAPPDLPPELPLPPRCAETSAAVQMMTAALSATAAILRNIVLPPPCRSNASQRVVAQAAKAARLAAERDSSHAANPAFPQGFPERARS